MPRADRAPNVTSIGSIGQYESIGMHDNREIDLDQRSNMVMS